ncbi:16S rRNA (guanine(966)-N(2))-methyltransferase RsmD [Alkalihalobacillus sp. AL-G]|uniref:16S rRNA (guanine(966)-N(2))-methyltransferase RsmD n=1 Tax=Alkalihalobacillus sp. AL-G TaxID=2926399 RepID=UPI00272D10BC|nr:16S rRNA (guanine(966)-N(2))-methyltransferase RsmD [Alkalihalobacillus sp. AL-G]WLD95042.1 16S rRNA (guanine(966)-N(2))-methyltransferase RsmD [Alkalihalobacillus sp. AL-G]
MRVISGNQKGRKLKAVPGTSTRPTTDKIRESIFNMVGPYFDGGTSLDLYGGSGALTIEGISRGIERGVIVDVDPKAIDTIRENLRLCNYTDEVEVYRNDSKRALKALKKREIAFKYVYLDPPYKKQRIEKEIEALSQAHLLEPNAIIIVEHDSNLTLSDQVETCTKLKAEKYNNTTSVTIFINDPSQEENPNE